MYLRYHLDYVIVIKYVSQIFYKIVRENEVNTQNLEDLMLYGRIVGQCTVEHHRHQFFYFDFSNFYFSLRTVTLIRDKNSFLREYFWKHNLAIFRMSDKWFRLEMNEMGMPMCNIRSTTLNNVVTIKIQVLFNFLDTTNTWRKI